MYKSMSRMFKAISDRYFEPGMASDWLAYTYLEISDFATMTLATFEAPITKE